MDGCYWSFRQAQYMERRIQTKEFGMRKSGTMIFNRMKKSNSSVFHRGALPY